MTLSDIPLIVWLAVSVLLGLIGAILTDALCRCLRNVDPFPGEEDEP